MNRPTLEIHGSIGALGAEWDPLFAAGPGIQTSRAWFAATEAAALPAGAEPRFVAVRDEAGPAALFPMQDGPGRRRASLTTPYTCLYQPLFRPAASAALLREAAAALGRHARRHPLTIFEALDPDWPGFEPLRSGLAASGLGVRGFEHFGNWHEPVQGASWDAYLGARPGPLRETVRRRTRTAARDHEIRLELVGTPEALPAALAAYEEVYSRSWKQPEPFPGFNGALVRALAPTGVLRIGVMWVADQPIAAQYWTVRDGTATVLKLAHDEARKSLSPGTVLTAFVVRRLLEEGVRELDFGRGDDPYKRGWARHRRRRVGLLAVNPVRPAGFLALLRHDAGRVFRTTGILLEHLSRNRGIGAGARDVG